MLMTFQNRLDIRGFVFEMFEYSACDYDPSKFDQRKGKARERIIGYRCGVVFGVGHLAYSVVVIQIR
jgi:hypothetical protein